MKKEGNQKGQRRKNPNARREDKARNLFPQRNLGCCTTLPIFFCTGRKLSFRCSELEFSWIGERKEDLGGFYLSPPIRKLRIIFSWNKGMMVIMMLTLVPPSANHSNHVWFKPHMQFAGKFQDFTLNRNPSINYQKCNRATKLWCKAALMVKNELYFLHFSRHQILGLSTLFASSAYLWICTFGPNSRNQFVGRRCHHMVPVILVILNVIVNLNWGDFNWLFEDNPCHLQSFKCWCLCDASHFDVLILPLMLRIQDICLPISVLTDSCRGGVVKDPG